MSRAIDGTLVGLGRAVRTRRQAEGLTQADLARMSGMHRNYIGGIERGEREPSLRSVTKLSHALGLEPHELLKLAAELR